MSRVAPAVKQARTRVLAADTNDHYAVLGVAPGASEETVKLAHRALARMFHPDLCRLGDAHDLCSRVNVAYAVLGDREARRKYDVVRRSSLSYCPRCSGAGVVSRQRGFTKKESVTCPACNGSGVVS